MNMDSIVKSVPDGYHTVTPYLSIKGAKDALAFYARAFGAEVVYQLDMPGGKIGHAEIRIGDSRIMLADEMPQMPDAVTKSPATLRATTVGLCLYVDDVDQRFKLAVEAGAIVKRPVADQFYGDRNGTLQDPFGHVWTLATHIENVSTEEMRKRMESLPKG
jgi:PhnB protein